MFCKLKKVMKPYLNPKVLQGNDELVFFIFHFYKITIQSKAYQFEILKSK